MIPAPSTTVEFDTLPGEEIEFGIGDPRWVMRTQADMYSDISTAIAREYATNAWDAHVMAGHTDPIEVTLPSAIQPFYIVRDHGVGISEDLFRRVYTQFGVSDKRDSAVTNGMLGYGSKSAVAYTSQFEVTSVRDGKRIDGVVKRMPDWSIKLKMTSQKSTDEPSGTVIRIPIHNIDEFNAKARTFFSFWPAGRVLLNGEPVKQNVGRKIADNLYYSTSWNTSYVVMGNVPYRINNPSALFRDTEMTFVNFVAYVDSIPMEDGAQAVEFTPTREDLKYTDRTKETLQKVIHDFEDQIKRKAQDDVNNAPDHAAAFVAYSHWKSTLGGGMFKELTYKGDKFHDDFSLVATRYSINASHNSTQSIRMWNATSDAKTMYVTDCDINVSSSVKERARRYIKLKDWEITYVVFTPVSHNDIKSVWIKKEHSVTWADLKEALPKVPKDTSYSNRYNPNEGRLKGSWDYWSKEGYKSEEPLPDKGEVFYVTLQQNKRISVPSIIEHLNEDVVVLIVPQNRLTKLTRENPHIKEFYPYARSKVVTDGTSLLSKDAKAALDVHADDRYRLKSLDMTKVNDPEIVRLAGLVKDVDSLAKEYHRNNNLAAVVGMRYNGVKFYESTGSRYLLDTYPLVGSVVSKYSKPHEHTYIYLNAVYAAKKEK